MEHYSRRIVLLKTIHKTRTNIFFEAHASYLLVTASSLLFSFIYYAWLKKLDTHLKYSRGHKEAEKNLFDFKSANYVKKDK